MLILTDKEIMFEVRDGNINKLSLLFERYNVKLYNYFMKLCRNRQASEDMVQEVFLKLIKYRRSYRGDGIFTTWLFQIAHNIFYDYIRKDNKNLSIEDDNIDIPDTDNLHETVAEKEEKKMIEKALYKLKGSDREVLVLSRYMNMKYKEISVMMDMPEGTVKFRVHQALKKLKEVYQKISDEV